MPQAFSVPISDVVSLLRLERKPNTINGASAYYVTCPFCDKAGRYHMNVNESKGTFRCVICEQHGGVLDLYAQVKHGISWQNTYSRREIFQELKNDLGEPAYKEHALQRRNTPWVREIYPVKDVDLDRIYRALMRLPYLRVNQKHGENLQKRGLLPDEIRSHYATLPKADVLLKRHPHYKEMLDWYHTANVDQLRTDNPAFKALYKKDILAGLLIAHDLEEMGLKLKYTPGFFKIADKWCFRYLTGILIPTISFENNIVCFQVRRDASKGGLRYLTVSSKGLPGGPTTGLSRIHIAHDAPIDGNTTVYITEGPLKANVILSLLRQRGCQNTAVIAIQGVSNVKELPDVLVKVKQCGVTKIIMLFDMDKTGNMNIARSTAKIHQIILDAGIAPTSYYWDAEYAITKRTELSALCKLHDIPDAKTDNPFSDIYRMAKSLTDADIEYSVIYENGVPFKDHWRSETKGYDDYLLWQEAVKSNSICTNC